MNINALDLHGRSALHLACLCHHLDTAELLIESGINIHIIDDIGKMALDYITNDAIREELWQSSVYQTAERVSGRAPFIIVMSQHLFVSPEDRRMLQWR